MCGIVGYIGKEQAAPILLEGLSRLEYRGYDSAGVCVAGENGLQIAKAKGRLKNLMELTQNGATLHGTTGIGHTRWATHGEPNDINSHPHVSEDGKIALVHNGIIENYLELRQFLQAKGVHLPPRPIRRSWRSCWSIFTRRPERCSGRSTWCCTGSRARTRSASYVPTRREGSMPRERTHRC